MQVIRAIDVDTHMLQACKASARGLSIPWPLGSSLLGTGRDLTVVLANATLRIDSEANVRVLCVSRLKRCQQIACKQPLGHEQYDGSMVVVVWLWLVEGGMIQ
jgi:hypothetical protein